MVTIRVNVFPILFLVCSILTLCIPYFLSVLNKHVEVIWPYISDTGSRRPESCYFSLFLNIATVPLFVMFHSRYVLINIKIEELDSCEAFRCLNFASFLLGNVIAFSLVLVANFQSTAVPFVHFVGAFLFFILSFIYMLFQVIIDFNLYCCQFEYWLVMSRFLLSLLYFCMYFVSAFYSWKAKRTIMDEITSGFPLSDHVISTITQWLAVMFLEVFLISLLYDFKRLILNVTICRIAPVDSSCCLERCASCYT